jgi:PAN domain
MKESSGLPSPRARCVWGRGRHLHRSLPAYASTHLQRRGGRAMQPMIGKSITYLAVSLAIFVFSPAHAFELTVETDTDRVGCDVGAGARNFPVPGPGVGYLTSAFVCANECGLDPSCQAWNYDPTTGTPEGHRCFLKNCAPDAISSPGKVGGVKLPFVIMSPGENKIDRPGNDYRNFAAPNQSVCSSACGSEPICQAWNYDFSSGLPGTCWLKSSVPPARSSDKVVGGVKFHPPATFTFEQVTDRRGCDYSNFPVPGQIAYPDFAPAIVCSNECGLDPICQAWNYDTTQGNPGAHLCFLKNCVPPTTPSQGNTSGVKGPPSTMGFEEVNVDRVGEDYRNFTAANDVVCSEACALDPICQAYNWDYRSGFPGTCWLKSSVPFPQSSDRVVGGVKFHPAVE